MDGCKMFSITLERSDDYIFAVSQEREPLIHRLFLYMQLYDTYKVCRRVVKVKGKDIPVTGHGGP
jgi:hypothetical protein